MAAKQEAITRVKWTCKACGVRRRVLAVRARTDEDVTVWVRQTVDAVGQAHRQASPACTSKILDELLIQTDGTDRIGGAPRPPIVRRLTSGK